mmetsp:Transcript_87501/g.276502  ORF Transcript_87501/g.276502 Transcript_87501/m.276502 type:complete len:216 (-) Transcript_87501:25-672(-)
MCGSPRSGCRCPQAQASAGEAPGAAGRGSQRARGGGTGELQGKAFGQHSERRAAPVGADADGPIARGGHALRPRRGYQGAGDHPQQQPRATLAGPSRRTLVHCRFTQGHVEHPLGTKHTGEHSVHDPRGQAHRQDRVLPAHGGAQSPRRRRVLRRRRGCAACPRVVLPRQAHVRGREPAVGVRLSNGHLYSVFSATRLPLWGAAAMRRRSVSTGG